MAKGSLHILKLCVGVNEVGELVDWQARRMAETGRDTAVHVTRMWPKRAEQLLDGGSLYWVIRGEIRARQTILGLEERIGDDGIARCAIILHPNVVQTARVQRRPFQGWRYLKAAEAPRDLLTETCGELSLPESLAAALTEIGVR